MDSVLTIEPGVVVKLEAMEIRTSGAGKIIAEGTAANRMTFTSFADDSLCGDSDGDGSATEA